MEAIDAAVEVATGLGVEVGTPLLLRSTNNIVALLSPTPVVVKISDEGGDALAYELEVGRFLAEAGAPIAAPDRVLGHRVHRLDRFSLTFWRYLEADADTGPSVSVARSLLAFHSRARGVQPTSGPVPHYLESVTDVRLRLEDRRFAAGFTDGERDLVCTTIDSVLPTLESRRGPEAVLHGSPHGYNVVWVKGQAFFVDLESVCRGPVEWDLAYLEAAAAAAYPGPVDHRLIAACRRLISAGVASWCMEGIERGPDMEWHARNHLGHLGRSAR